MERCQVLLDTVSVHIREATFRVTFAREQD